MERERGRVRFGKGVAENKWRKTFRNNEKKRGVHLRDGTNRGHRGRGRACGREGRREVHDELIAIPISDMQYVMYACGHQAMRRCDQVAS